MSQDGAAAAIATATLAASAVATATAAAAGATRKAETQILATTPSSGHHPVTELRNASSSGRIERSNRNGNGALMPPPPPPSQLFPYASHRLRLNPDFDHKPDDYEDLQLDFSPLLFSSLERYLPPTLLNSSRDTKVHYIRDILLRYSTESERNRVSSSAGHTVISIFFLGGG